MRDTIFYWHGLIIDSDIAEKYSCLIDKLKSGQLQSSGLDLKKMKGYRIYSLKSNDAGRLLFTTISINQKQYLLFLEELPNHEYNQSRFLNNSSCLRDFLEKQSSEYHAIVNFNDEFTAVEEFPVNVHVEKIEESSSKNYIPVEYYNKQFIILNEQQITAIAAKGPAIISGPPGSGKSCSALLLLSMAAAYKQKIIYLSSAPRLVNHMRDLWRDLPEAQACVEGTVVFKTYEELMFDEAPKSQNTNLVGKEHFIEWFKAYSKSQKKIVETKHKTNKLAKGQGKKQSSLLKEDYDAEEVYQEFRTVAAYVNYSGISLEPADSYNKIAYLNLGEDHQSLFKREHRVWIYNAYTSYSHYLAESSLLDVSLYRFNPKQYYDVVVIDESQDFSKVQIHNLTELAGPAMQIYFCRDSHQSLTDCKSSGPFIQEHLYKIGKARKLKPQLLDLPFSYRVFPNAKSLVDRVLDLRMKLIGGRADAMEYISLPLTIEQSSTLGSLYWFNKVPKEAQVIMQDAANSTQCAIITLPEHLVEARSFFNTENVYTIDQIKGLQFSVVVLFRMLDTKIMVEANRLLASPEQSYISQSSSSSRPPSSVGDSKFGIVLNGFFTAATRALQELIIIQPEKHQLKYIIDAIKPSLPSEIAFRIELDKKSYSDQEWISFAANLIADNNLSLARQILLDYLKKSESYFNDLLMQHRVIPRSSVSDINSSLKSNSDSSSLSTSEFTPHPKHSSGSCSSNSRAKPASKPRCISSASSKTSAAKSLTNSSKSTSFSASLDSYSNSTISMKLNSSSHSVRDNTSKHARRTHVSTGELFDNYNRFEQFSPEDQIIKIKQVDDQGFNLLMLILQQLPQGIKKLMPFIISLSNEDTYTILNQLTLRDNFNAMMIASKDLQAFSALAQIMKKLNKEQKFHILREVTKGDGFNSLMLAASTSMEALILIIELMSDLDQNMKFVLLTSTSKPKGNNALMLATGLLRNPLAVAKLVTLISTLFPYQISIILNHCSSGLKYNVLMFAAYDNPQSVVLILGIMKRLDMREQYAILSQTSIEYYNALMLAAKDCPKAVPRIIEAIERLEHYDHKIKILTQRNLDEEDAESIAKKYRHHEAAELIAISIKKLSQSSSSQDDAHHSNLSATQSPRLFHPALLVEYEMKDETNTASHIHDY